ncbi:RraA family protein [Micromonospora sp. NPDC005299]|uniref:RraA family protein n=1 Tax=Micromonospora sp. NPDC005299 TaxID=3364231 RepID=UPI0036C48C67
MSGPSGAESPLAGLGAATVFEASDRVTALPSRIKPLDPEWTLVGRAVPVVCAGGSNWSLHQALAAAGHGDVLVASVGSVRRRGYWGELMTRAALVRGIAGLVIDGDVRDSRQIRALGFPVFATGLSVAGVGKSDESCSLPAGVARVAGRTVHHGDLVIGDADGVVIVPDAEVDRVVASALRRCAREERIISELEQGVPLLDLLGIGGRGSAALVGGEPV